MPNDVVEHINTWHSHLLLSFAHTVERREDSEDTQRAYKGRRQHNYVHIVRALTLHLHRKPHIRDPYPLALSYWNFLCVVLHRQVDQLPFCITLNDTLGVVDMLIFIMLLLIRCSVHH